MYVRRGTAVTIGRAERGPSLSDLGLSVPRHRDNDANSIDDRDKNTEVRADKATSRHGARRAAGASLAFSLIVNTPWIRVVVRN
ncbi:hypothetical protein EVAR_22472_1 [Eumeta japonica]|uniref:Uncharacterized protein n=1 Tax=Eumeta variegata TaxID=151549 RepID=A0A4C1VCT3_EUMVA|nr:hypothetical protein EVAR_22472_1 [Eumeta japonica]